MKALILAAGFGTRLQEELCGSPKCLVEAGEEAMLGHVINRCKEAGIRELVINLHYQAELVRQYVEDRRFFDIDIQFSLENPILGTGGAIRKARKFFAGEDFFLVHNADVYSDISMNELFRFARLKNSFATLAMTKRETSRPLLFNEAQELIGYESKQKGIIKLLREERNPLRLAFSGIQVVSQRIFEVLESFEEEFFSSIAAYLRAVEKGQKVHGLVFHDALWHDVGTPERLQALRKYLDRRSEQ